MTDKREPLNPGLMGFVGRCLATAALIWVLQNIPVVAVADSLQSRLTAARVVDLTHQIHAGMAVWPGGVPFRMERLVDYDQGYRLHKFCIGENTGTHIDAPAHFFADGKTITDLTPQELLVPLVVIDVTKAVALDADYQISTGDISDWEEKFGAIPAGSLVVAHTGWYQWFAEPAHYVNLDSDGVMHFPGFSLPAAELLLTRGVAGIGIDTLSLDAGNTRGFPVHQRMLAAGLFQLENLANLAALPPTSATAIVGVLPVRGGSQAQARILAIVDE